ARRPGVKWVDVMEEKLGITKGCEGVLRRAEANGGNKRVEGDLSMPQELSNTSNKTSVFCVMSLSTEKKWAREKIEAQVSEILKSIQNMSHTHGTNNNGSGVNVTSSLLLSYHILVLVEICRIWFHIAIDLIFNKGAMISYRVFDCGLKATGIRCPTLLLLRLQVLVMEFIGTTGWAAPRLKDAALSLDKLREGYVECEGYAENTTEREMTESVTNAFCQIMILNILEKWGLELAEWGVNSSLAVTGIMHK
ncbi:hypothetical protein M8C21_021687, partial [Ambrosia artemisiifolia]